jgi:SAM-dependent methyltransferase
MLKDLLTHPLARGIDLDDPRTTILRKRILEEKRFLRHIYEEWYQLLLASLPPMEGLVLELGTGAGFLRDFLPGLITSDVLPLPDMSVVMNAYQIPFQDASLRGILMIDVLHHLAAPRTFFAEATRCVKPGGVITMIEPWVTPWSRLVYTLLHHEPFHPEATQWEFPTSGPLSGANGALPWMMFHRDRCRFTSEFPEWRVRSIDPDMPLSYLLSGGVSWRSFMPAAAFKPVRWLEKHLKPWNHGLAMFARISLDRVDD